MKLKIRKNKSLRKRLFITKHTHIEDQANKKSWQKTVAIDQIMTSLMHQKRAYFSLEKMRKHLESSVKKMRTFSVDIKDKKIDLGVKKKTKNKSIF